MPTPKQGYYLADGKTRVPSVTTITGRFKDAGGLIAWANRIGLEGKSLAEERDKAADAGTLAHALVEAHIRGQDVESILLDIPEDIQAGGKQGYDNWVNWMAQTNLSVEAWEHPLVCECYRYGGTPDALGSINGHVVLVDWKTGGLYPEHLIQLAAYAHLFEDAGYPITGGFHLASFSRQHGDFRHYYFNELDSAWRMFQALREAYDLDKDLKNRVK